MKDIPKKYTDMVGKEQEFRGGLFSGKKAIPPTKMTVYGVRWSDTYIINLKTMKAKHPAVEFLVQSADMKRSRWTRPFAVREINLKGNA